MDDPIVMKPESAFGGVLRAAGDAINPGVIVREVTDLSVALIVAMEPVLGLTDGPKRTTWSGVDFLGVGPGKWLALGNAASFDFSHKAAVIDQSGGYGLLEISGRDVVATLEKGIGIDLHPNEFADDDVAVTVCSHIGVVLWRGDANSFRLAVPRSYAASFWLWLESSAAEFGLRVASE